MIKRVVPGLLARPLLAAISSGILVFVVMRDVVLPLSAFPFPVRIIGSLASWLDLGPHIVLFALPIVLMARRARRPGQQPLRNRGAGGAAKGIRHSMD